MPIRRWAGSGSGTAQVEWEPNAGDNLTCAGEIDLDSIATIYSNDCLATIDTYVVNQTYEVNTCQCAQQTLIYDVVYLAGSDAANNDGPDNWTNPNNANGLRDAAEASRTGSIGGVEGNLRLTYPDPSGGLPDFTISLVELRYDTRQTGTALNNGGLHHEYRIGAAGGWTSLEIFTGNVDNNPKTYDITAAIGGSWTNINDLQVRVRAVLGATTSLVTCFCDAVELRIVAQRTISL